jgi:hypothetical protein
MATRGREKGTCNKSIVRRVRRGLLTAVAILCDLTGIVWILQGTGVLPGSFMTGEIVWAVIGAVLLFVSGVLLWAAYRPTSATGRDS